MGRAASLHASRAIRRSRPVGEDCDPRFPGPFPTRIAVFALFSYDEDSLSLGSTPRLRKQRLQSERRVGRRFQRPAGEADQR